MLASHTHHRFHHRYCCCYSRNAVGEVTQVHQHELITELLLLHELVPLPVRRHHMITRTLEATAMPTPPSPIKAQGPPSHKAVIFI